MAKKIRMRLPATWSIEVVTGRMLKPCCQCEKRPEGMRLVRQIDSYPYPTKAIYCTACAVVGMRNKLKVEESLIVAFEASLVAAGPGAVAPLTA